MAATRTAREVIIASLEALGFVPGDFAITSNAIESGNLVFEAVNVARDITVSASVEADRVSGITRVYADCESACHSWHRSAVL
jgi:hypothetical protein